MEPPIDLELPHERRRRQRRCHCSADFCRCVVGECLCTFFFILIAGTLDLDWSDNTGSTACPPSDQDIDVSDSIVETADAAKIVQIALTLGLGVATLSQCFEHISGAHMNPAVTVAFLVTRQVSLMKGSVYILVQFVGGFTAVFLLRGFIPFKIQGQLGYTTPSSLVTYHQAFGMELLTTFVFVLACLASADTHRGLPKNQSLQIGLAYAMVTLWGFSFTGANMNPVRSVAPAVVLNIPDAMWLPILEVYIAGPLLGSIASALVYRYVFNMHRATLDVTESQHGSSIYDPEIDLSLRTLQRMNSYRGKMVSEM